MGSKGKGSTEAMGEARVGMPADCRMGDVGDLHGRLLAALDTSHIVLDGSAVDRVDTAALQLLVALQHTAKKRAQQVSWAGVSEPLHDAANQLGLAQVLALPTKPSA